MPDLPKLPELRFRYGEVERALASIYAAADDDVRRSDFRARINYFQRAKVIGKDVQVGTGQRADYNVRQIERWCCCMELCELGVSPTTAGELVVSLWDSKLVPIFRAAQKTTNNAPSLDDIALCLGGLHLMSGKWSPGSSFPGVPSIDHCTLRRLPDRVMGWMRMTAGDREAPRLSVVNLSERLRQFHTALAAAYRDELIAGHRAETDAGKVEARVDRRWPRKR
jgi:hypothetical protein